MSIHQLVPHFILENYRLGNFSDSLEAAGLFVDLSGFSKMADILSGYEQPGAEALAEVMRKVFEPLVEAVYSQGGFVVGYSGDAFTAIFPGQQDRDSAMLRCLEAAIKMQAHVYTHPQIETPFGEYPLSLKVGISYGEAKWNILKSSNGKRATYYIFGSCVEGAVIAEKCAQPGEILVDKSAYPHLSAVIDGEPIDECFRIYDVKTVMPTPRSFSNPNSDPDLLQMFVPKKIVSLPTVGEFRQVVNLFIDIPLDPTNDSLVAPFMDVVFNLQERYGGFFLRPEVSDKGFNLLMFWGAPVAYETDIDRVLNFILDLRVQSGLPISAGITYLSAYAGFMGVPLREDYTAYGWGVNLSARFMKMAAPNEIWIDEQVARRAERNFIVTYRDMFSVKGFKRKQKVFTLNGRKELVETIYQGELIGRTRELEHLSEFVRPIFEGDFAGVMILKGEAGIGKSRLVHALQVSDVFENNPVQWVVCQTDEILRQSLNPFQDWLSKRFLVSNSQSDAGNLDIFNSQLQALIDATSIPDLATELDRTRSILAALLGLTQPGSLYEQLDAKERYENTFIALSTLFRAESLQKPLIIFIEDIQWLDDDTQAFLPYLVRILLAEGDISYPIAILTTRRPDRVALKFGEVLEPQLLDLDRLPASELSSLSENILGGKVSEPLLELLERRTEGNPFFAEQILRYLVDRKLITNTKEGLFDADARAERSLPLDVGAILIARLDSLTQDVRNVVQTASILGREFEVQLLARMIRGEIDILQKISHAERAEIWFPLDQIRYIFRHALLRDAAYTMQLLTRQRELHALAVSAIELLYASELEPHYGELAYHAERALLVDKALLYLPQAGKLAANVYQNRQAVDFFSRALALIPSEDLHAQFDHLLARANLHGLMGERDLQLKDLEMLERLARQLDDDSLLAQAWMLRADYAYGISDYQFALEKAKDALNLAQSTGIEAVALDAYRVSPLALLRQGKLDEAMLQAKEGLLLVRQLGRRIEEGNILNSMGLIALEQKEPKSAQEYFEQALNIARETSNRGLETKSLNNLGTSAGFILGDYITAREYYEQAYLIARERGDRSLQSATLGNLGWASGMQGDFEAARAYHEKALLLAREVGDIYHEIYTLINLGSVAINQTESIMATKYSQQANELSQQIGERSGKAWSLLYLGHAYLLDKKNELAKNYFQESKNIREELSQKSLATEPAAGLIQVALEMNDMSIARDETENIIQYLGDGGTLEGTEEPLRIYLACYQAMQKLEDPRSTAVLKDAVQLLEAQVSNLPDEEARQMFIQNVPCRRAIFEAWQNLQRDSR
jgi:predicted ATPase/class 3 adenylate cyclase